MQEPEHFFLFFSFFSLPNSLFVLQYIIASKTQNKKQQNAFQLHKLSPKAEDHFIHFPSLCKQQFDPKPEGDNHIVKQLKKDAKENNNQTTTGVRRIRLNTQEFQFLPPLFTPT